MPNLSSFKNNHHIFTDISESNYDIILHINYQLDALIIIYS